MAYQRLDHLIMKIQAIVLAAGMGTRMKSYLPKVLHRVCGQSLVERTIRALKESGVAKTTVVVGSGREQVELELSRIGIGGVDTAVQESQNGTGDAAKSALPNLTEETAVILPGDIPLLSADVLKTAIASIKTEVPLLFVSFKAENPKGFGRVIRDNNGSVVAICEEKDCNDEQRKIDEVNAGIYFCSKSFLEESLSSLNTDNAQGEYYLTDIVSYACEKGLAVEAICVEPAIALQGANSRKDLSALEIVRRSQIAEMLMDNGVTLEDPSQTYVDEGVKVGKDSWLGAGTRLKGSTILADNVVVEGNSIIENCTIGSGSHIKISSSLEDSEVGENTAIGPCAHLRPGSKIGNNCKVGNFVETKKSVLHDGVKAGHLSYLGDAEIFPEANIGAGTITCNYDGTNKHKTQIGKKAFIGSNTCLVAPVEVGDKAYIGAGSTITKKVPDRALGLGRSRQTNKEGWNKD